MPFCSFESNCRGLSDFNGHKEIIGVSLVALQHCWCDSSKVLMMLDVFMAYDLDGNMLLVSYYKIRRFSDKPCRDARVVNGYDSNAAQAERRYHMVSAA